MTADVACRMFPDGVSDDGFWEWGAGAFYWTQHGVTYGWYAKADKLEEFLPDTICLVVPDEPSPGRMQIYREGTPKPPRIGGDSWAWNGDLWKPTLRPSINHVDVWHGWLTNGVLSLNGP